MVFENKQFDGPYEIIKIELKNQNDSLKGLIYLPPNTFDKPYPLIIYFHCFPQLFSLKEIIKNYDYLLNSGYAFLAFNFRGYKDNFCELSLKSHLSDAKRVFSHVEISAGQGLFDLSDINLIAQDFGGFIGLLIASKIKILNRILLLSPILNLKNHIYNEDFKKNLEYITRFIPGNLQGIQEINTFIELTKKELSRKDHDVERAIKKLNVKKFAVIHGEDDKITPVDEVKQMLKEANVPPQLIFIKSMDHEYIIDSELEDVNKEIENFFR